MALFGKERRPDVPEIEVRGDQATLYSGTDASGPDESHALSVPQNGQSRDLRLPKTKWWYGS